MEALLSWGPTPSIKKNPAYGRHWISRLMRIVSPLWWNFFRHLFLFFFEGVEQLIFGAGLKKSTWGIYFLHLLFSGPQFLLRGPYFFFIIFFLRFANIFFEGSTNFYWGYIFFGVQKNVCRRFKKISWGGLNWQTQRQTDRHLDMATLWLNRPSGANSVKTKKTKISY